MGKNCHQLQRAQYCEFWCHPCEWSMSLFGTLCDVIVWHKNHSFMNWNCEYFVKSQPMSTANVPSNEMGDVINQITIYITSNQVNFVRRERKTHSYLVYFLLSMCLWPLEWNSSLIRMEWMNWKFDSYRFEFDWKIPAAEKCVHWLLCVRFVCRYRHVKCRLACTMRPHFCLHT